MTQGFSSCGLLFQENERKSFYDNLKDKSIVRKLILIHQPSKYNLKNCDEETHTVRRLITIAKNTNLVEVDWSEELVAFSMQWSFWSHFNLEQILLILYLSCCPYIRSLLFKLLTLDNFVIGSCEKWSLGTSLHVYITNAGAKSHRLIVDMMTPPPTILTRQLVGYNQTLS
uniref:Uncharacterized protein n=1 Tax=Glossina pallidipes TaxID=7398 RepID=A0A1B0AJD4_GLOPL